MSATAAQITGQLPRSDVEETDPRFDAIAQLKPRLREDLDIHQQRFRGEHWWVIADPLSSHNYRVDAVAHSMLSQLDGATTMAAAYRKVTKTSEFSKNDALMLLLHLQQADLITDNCPGLADPSLLERHAKFIRQSPLKQLAHPLSIRVPLIDPDRFLDWCSPVIKILTGKLAGIISLSLMFIGALMALQHLSSLTAFGAARADNLASLGLLICVYPIVKGLHEFAHAAMVKLHGGEVHEMGIMFLVFMPVPYVDASVSGSFEKKSARIGVAAAGIYVELLLASLAIILWTTIQDGFIREAAFAVALIGGVSTLLFNGNPLLRFDGYFVFADWVEIPNLASRSRNYCLYLIRRYGLGVNDATSPVTGRKEGRWLFGYGVAATLYRFIILFSICLFIAAAVPLLGAMLACWTVYSQIIKPSLQGVRYLIMNDELRASRTRAWLSTGAFLSLVVLLVTATPMANWTRTEGLVQFPETAMVRAGESGFVAEIYALDGQLVSKGQPIARLDNREIDTEIAKLQWRINELEARRAEQIVKSPVEAAMLAETLENVRLQLSDAQFRLDALTLRAPVSGVIEFVNSTDWQGRYVSEGNTFAHVLSDTEARIITVVPQAAIADIRHKTTTVTLRSTERPNESIAARVIAITPSASRELPNAAFGSQRGGDIAVDSRETSGKQTLEEVFQLEIAPLAANVLMRPGSRAVIRFEHTKETLAAKIMQATRRLFLAEFQW